MVLQILATRWLKEWTNCISNFSSCHL